jgi:hypothetical protein
VRVEGVVVGHGEPLVAKSSELGFIPTPPPSMGGALAPLVVSADLAHLRAWEVGWGNGPLDLCGVLVRESRSRQHCNPDPERQGTYTRLYGALI